MVRLSDLELASAADRLAKLESRLRECLVTEDQAERDSVLNALRQTVPLRRAIDTWLSLRALRATLSRAASSARTA